MQHQKFHITVWNLRKSGCQIMMYTSDTVINIKNCFKFPQLYFCQIVFELVYIWESYHKSEKVTFFWNTYSTVLNSEVDWAVFDN